MNRLSDHMTGKKKTKPTKTNKSVLQKKIVDRQILNELIGLDLITEEFYLPPSWDYVLMVFILSGKKYSQMCMICVS